MNIELNHLIFISMKWNQMVIQLLVHISVLLVSYAKVNLVRSHLFEMDRYKWVVVMWIPLEMEAKKIKKPFPLENTWRFIRRTVGQKFEIIMDFRHLSSADLIKGLVSNWLLVVDGLFCSLAKIQITRIGFVLMGGNSSTSGWEFCMYAKGPLEMMPLWFGIAFVVVPVIVFNGPLNGWETAKLEQWLEEKKPPLF